MSRATAPPLGEFAASIRSCCPEATLGGDPSAYTVDGIAPSLVLAPGASDELSLILAEAQRQGVALVPAGAGTALGYGNPPRAYDAALSTRRMAGVIAYEPMDLTVSVQAGLPLARLQAELAEQGQFLPLDPPCDPGATIGGVIAANEYGPLRHAYGTVRDWLIGIRVAHADGSLTRSGGKVVKNVAGYDMTKLYAGSLGSLGVIVEASFKVAPLPKAEVTASAAFDSPEGAAAFVAATHDAGLSVRAAELLSPSAAGAVTGDATWTVVARVAGSAAAVERSLRELRERCDGGLQTHDAAAWDRWRSLFRPRALSMRGFVLPSDVARGVAVLDRRFAGTAARLSATVGAGVIRLQAEPHGDERARALVAAAREVVGRAGGNVVIDAAAPAVKQAFDVFGEPRSDFEIMRRLKQEFDPAGILAPGRFAGRL